VTDRIRGRRLQAIRAAHFARFPLCVHCEAKGRTRLATELDHIKAVINGGEDSRDPFVNRQGLCDECHDTKTIADLGLRPKQAFGADGEPLPCGLLGGYPQRFRKR
jgi:5-methylcytosine-specific restriction protein A